MIVINSDDFGYSESVNRAISDSFKKGLISSTTLIVNRGNCFIDALSYIRTNIITSDKIGLHVNLEDGRPLTENIQNLNFICNSEGNFSYTFREKNRFYFSDKFIKRCIKDEISAQIMKFKEHISSLPTHIDSHNHTHTELGMLFCLMPIMNDFKIKRIRLTRNVGKNISVTKKIYKTLFNTLLRTYNLKTVDYFGDINDFKTVKFQNNFNYEIMVHAYYDEFNNLHDLGGKDLEKSILGLIDLNKQRIVPYSSII